jgi:hypothetical protein
MFDSLKYEVKNIYTAVSHGNGDLSGDGTNKTLT